MDLKETDILGDKIATHWYYRSKAQAMRRLLIKTNVSTILDVGAGSFILSTDAVYFARISTSALKMRTA